MILLRQKIFMLNTYKTDVNGRLLRDENGKFIKEDGGIANGGGYSLTGDGTIVQGSGGKAKDRKAGPAPKVIGKTKQGTDKYEIGTGQLTKTRKTPEKMIPGLGKGKGKSGVSASTGVNAINNARSNNQSIISQQTQRTERRDAIKKQQQMIANNSYKQGQQSVGILGGAKNTWDSMNNTQKGLAIGGTAAVLAGGAALAIRNRNKRKQAERELEEERARNRR